MRTLLLAFLFTTPMFATLPPFAQAEREIKMIIESDELNKFIPYSDIFEQIVKTDEGYLISTNKREIRAIIHYSKDSRIGPAQFSVEFQK